MNPFMGRLAGEGGRFTDGSSTAIGAGALLRFSMALGEGMTKSNLECFNQ